MNRRREFEHNAFLLAEALRMERISFNQRNHYTIKGIKNVKKLPNQRIDLHTVDDFARNAMNMAANIAYRSKQEKNDDNAEK
jgi:hypothetical protein